jgi:hypothetical protein
MEADANEALISGTSALRIKAALSGAVCSACKSEAKATAAQIKIAFLIFIRSFSSYFVTFIC